MPECHFSLPPIEFQALPESSYIRAEKEEQYQSEKGSPRPPLTKPLLLFLLPPNEREGGGGAAITEGSICASVNVWKVGGEVEEGGTFTFNSSRSDSGEGLVYRRGSR